MKSILDSSFRYTPSIATDLRKTFERIRRERAPGIAPRSSMPRLAVRPAAAPAPLPAAR